MYCTDTDLLRWEPTIAAEAAFATQTLLVASATLAGTTLTLNTGSLMTSRVRAGLVAVLSGAINGCYPILSIDSATTCTVSIMHDGLDDEPVEPAPVGTAVSGLNVAVRTFAPQRRMVSDLLTWMCGIEPGNSGGASVLNPFVLRRPCALGTLHMIYNAMAAAATGDVADLIVRAELYERLYRKALRSVIVEIDRDGDGEPDLRRPLRLIQFARI